MKGQIDIFEQWISILEEGWKDGDLAFAKRETGNLLESFLSIAGYSNEEIKKIISDVKSDIDKMFQEMTRLAKKSKALAVTISFRNIRKYVNGKKMEWNAIMRNKKSES